MAKTKEGKACKILQLGNLNTALVIRRNSKRVIY